MTHGSCQRSLILVTKVSISLSQWKVKIDRSPLQKKMVLMVFIYIYVYTFIKYILSWAIAMYLELAPRLWSFASTLSTAKRCFQKRCRKIGDWNESNVVIGVLVTETLVLTNRPRQIITPHWCRCMPQWKVWNCANWWDFLMGGPGVFKKWWTVFVDMIACHL